MPPAVFDWYCWFPAAICAALVAISAATVTASITFFVIVSLTYTSRMKQIDLPISSIVTLGSFFRCKAATHNRLF
jgi:hypothetical protein